MNTGYTFVQSPLHRYPNHPERPERFAVLKTRLNAFGAQEFDVQPASPNEIMRIHDPDLVSSLEENCKQGTSIIDNAPTFVTRTTFEDALQAAGGTLTCTREVLNKSVRNSFAIVRPPGHHAEPDRPMGFCIFNNVAVAAQAALDSGLHRVAIVDYDAHHGNGTQAAFLNDERVAYFSTHQWGIYPGTGWYEEAPHARKRIVNVPLPEASGELTFERLADQLLRPFIEAFKPQLLLISAGFDAHWKDPITSLGLTTRDFFILSSKLVRLAEEHCDGKIVFVLEGGYEAQNLANGVGAVFAALMQKPFSVSDDASPLKEPDSAARIEVIRELHGFQ